MLHRLDSILTLHRTRGHQNRLFAPLIDASLDLFSFNKLRGWQRDGVPCVAIASL